MKNTFHQLGWIYKGQRISHDTTLLKNELYIYIYKRNMEYSLQRDTLLRRVHLIYLVKASKLNRQRRSSNL